MKYIKIIIILYIILFNGCEKKINQTQQNVLITEKIEIENQKNNFNADFPANIYLTENTELKEINIWELNYQEDISEEFHTAKQFFDDINFMDSYNILDLNLNTSDTRTYLFFKPYNDRSLNLNKNLLSFTDAIIIKSDKEKVIQYLIIYMNGMVKTNDNITFYDFSNSTYLGFNGWLLELNTYLYDFDNVNSFGLQLTNNGVEVIPADPPLPVIIWDYKFNYPVKYEYLRYPLPYPSMLIEYEDGEDIKIRCARTGLRDEKHPGIFNYLDSLNDNDKEIIINAMFALYGYVFISKEWNDYFSKFLWYKPDNEIIHNVEILDEYQKKLLEYLLKKNP